MTCPVCGKKFHLKPFTVKRSKTHYCSRECFRIAKHEYMKGEGNHQYGLRGKKNDSWYSDRRISRYGYIQVRCLDHPFKRHGDFVFEHRLVAEKYLLNGENAIEIDGKKYLKPEYEVHHINFDRTDNRKENLMVLTHKEHKEIHSRLNPRKRDSEGRYVKMREEKIKIKRVTDTAVLPQKKSDEAAGYDLYVDSNKPIVFNPGESKMLHSGIAFQIPKGYFGAIYARSGLAVKMGLRPSTCVSVIDSDYRGEVGLPMRNDTNEKQIIQPHERVAQIVFQKHLNVEFEETDELDKTERGDGGFGSTGR